MGHYDDAYEADAERARKRHADEAKSEAKRRGLTLLKPMPQKVKPLGLCGECIKEVYVQPNWGCHREHCPHRPGAWR